jgi:hypothetical protein
MTGLASTFTGRKQSDPLVTWGVLVLAPGL